MKKTFYLLQLLAISFIAQSVNDLTISNKIFPATFFQNNSQSDINVTNGYIFDWTDFQKDNSEIFFTQVEALNHQVATQQEQFTEQTQIPFTGFQQGDIVWGDYDNDGDLDILITGDVNFSQVFTKIYRNEGGTFTEQTSINLDGTVHSSAAWGDYDNDGDLDILLTGTTGTEYISKIYRNNGDNTFTDQTSVSLVGVRLGSVAWGDYDNDGDLDILLTGQTSDFNPVSKIYRNNRDNTFTEQISIQLVGVIYSSVAWGDYDNDGNLDILLTGADNVVGRVSKIYRNNGDNTFTEQTSISLIGVSNGSAAWGDYDNDGDLDIILSGTPNSGPFVSKIYRNNGDNTFTEQTSISLIGIFSGSVAWGDYDNDGYLDIFLTGLVQDGTDYDTLTTIYRNNGNNTFSKQTSIVFTDIFQSSVAWGDYDNDGDLDILIAGTSHTGPVTKLYRNTTVPLGKQVRQ